MTTLALEGRRVTGCSVEARVQALLHVRLSGSAETAAADELVELFGAVHEQAVKLDASTVRVDLRELEFMNSSCFKSFVSWVLNVERLPPDRRYGIVLVQSPTKHWQKRSLHALRSMGGAIISIDAPA